MIVVLEVVILVVVVAVAVAAVVVLMFPHKKCRLVVVTQEAEFRSINTRLNVNGLKVTNTS